jgi:hypothetical protein
MAGHDGPTAAGAWSFPICCWPRPAVVLPVVAGLEGIVRGISLRVFKSGLLERCPIPHSGQCGLVPSPFCGSLRWPLSSPLGWPPIGTTCGPDDRSYEGPAMVPTHVLPTVPALVIGITDARRRSRGWSGSDGGVEGMR